MRVYGFLSTETETLINFYADVEAAQTAMVECLVDEPKGEALRVEPFEFETSLN
jgi:hypothetical protein